MLKKYSKYVSIEVMRLTSHSLEETDKIALDFVRDLKPKSDCAKVIGLYGNLGAGKTTFTQSVAKALGITEIITSPTFVIEKIYELTNQKFTHLIHIDAYRIEKPEELTSLGFQNIIGDKNNLILIEWPEKIEKIMPKHTKISLNPTENENSREIEIEFE
jgi:tRNA threonylcarbamoyladenosine biosynthesis protein TsaE